MEQQLGLAVSRIRPQDLKTTRLDDLDVLVLPDSDPLGSAYQESLGTAGTERLGRWIEAGGVFVGIGGGAALAARPEIEWTSSRPVTQPQEEPSGQGRATEAGAGSEEFPGVKDLPDPTPGAIARAVLDDHHFLTVGYGSWVAVPVVSRVSFTPSRHGRNVATFDEAGKLRLSGFMWDDTRAAMAEQAYLVSEPRGQGKVILFAGDPAFRGYWPNLHRLLLNAVLLAPSL
jgi:hypothetical protein